MSDTEKLVPGSYKEEAELLTADYNRQNVVNELIESVSEDDRDKETIQEILRFATTFTDEDPKPIQRYHYYDLNHGFYFSKIHTQYTNRRWLTPEYRSKVGMEVWNKAHQHIKEFFERKMRESEEKGTNNKY